MITYQFESFSTFYADSAWLMAEHDKEVSIRGMPYRLDFPLYRHLEATGQLYILTAREAGLMVGYLMFKLARHPHYPILVAWEDAHFLAKPWRKGLLNPWFRMVKLAHRVAKDHGAVEFVMHEKETKPLGPLFRRLGARRSDALWTVRL